MAGTISEDRNKITKSIIGAAIDVHKPLGPGLPESADEECLCFEMKQRGLIFERQVSLPVTYKEVELECGYRLDILVENKIIVELKAVDRIAPVHKAQVLTYLKLTKTKLGLLINFNIPVLKDGINRIIL